MGDLISDALSNTLNCERIGKSQCIIRPVNDLLKKILAIMKAHGYIGEFEYVNDNKGGIIKISLVKKINKCGSIRPRFSVKKDSFEKFEKRFLPAKGFGILILSTPQGIMTHHEAKQKNIGGILLSYIY